MIKGKDAISPTGGKGEREEGEESRVRLWSLVGRASDKIAFQKEISRRKSSISPREGRPERLWFFLRTRKHARSAWYDKRGKKGKTSPGTVGPDGEKRKKKKKRWSWGKGEFHDAFLPGKVKHLPEEDVRRGEKKRQRGLTRGQYANPPRETKKVPIASSFSNDLRKKKRKRSKWS